MALSDDVPRDMVVGKELCMEEQTEEQAMGFGYVLFYKHHACIAGEGQICVHTAEHRLSDCALIPPPFHRPCAWPSCVRCRLHTTEGLPDDTCTTTDVLEGSYRVGAWEMPESSDEEGQVGTRMKERSRPIIQIGKTVIPVTAVQWILNPCSWL